MQGRKLNTTSLLIHSLLVPKCVSCREPLSRQDRALCCKCMAEYLETKERNCSRCTKQYSKCLCTNNYLTRHFIKGLVKLIPYKNTPQFEAANALIYKMKKTKRKDIYDFMSDEIAGAVKSALPEIDKTAIITNVPNRRSAVIERGFDHAELLAKAVAEKLGCEYMPLLRSLAKKPQKNLTGNGRIANATFDLTYEPDIKGRPVLIIDDIVTTGASMGNSATMIRALNPNGIYGACVGVARSFINEE